MCSVFLFIRMKRAIEFSFQMSMGNKKDRLLLLLLLFRVCKWPTRVLFKSKSRASCFFSQLVAGHSEPLPHSSIHFWWWFDLDVFVFRFSIILVFVLLFPHSECKKKVNYSLDFFSKWWWWWGSKTRSCVSSVFLGNNFWWWWW